MAPGMLIDVKRRVALAAAAILLGVVAPGCGSSSSSACGPVVNDQLDPGSGIHVLPGAPAPSYIVDPPTSGAHQPVPQIEGPATEPIAPQLQVGMLEAGRVMIQYSDITDTEIAELEALNSTDVLVAPGKNLPGDTKVAATAWTKHQNCTAVDIDVLDKFIDHFAGIDSGQH